MENKTIALLGSICSIIGVIWIVKECSDTWKITNREKIEQYVNTIRHSFKPNNIVDENASSHDIVLIKDFQLAAIEYVNCWKYIEAIDPQQLPKDSSPGCIDYLLMNREIESHIRQYELFLSSICNVKRKINAILLNGQQNGIYEFARNIARWNHMNNGFELIDHINKEAKDAWYNNLNKLEKKYGDLDNLPAKELIKAMKPYYEMYNKKEALAFIEELMSYSIDLNANCMNYLNKQ